MKKKIFIFFIFSFMNFFLLAEDIRVTIHYCKFSDYLLEYSIVITNTSQNIFYLTNIKLPDIYFHEENLDIGLYQPNYVAGEKENIDTYSYRNFSQLLPKQTVTITHKFDLKKQKAIEYPQVSHIRYYYYHVDLEKIDQVKKVYIGVGAVDVSLLSEKVRSRSNTKTIMRERMNEVKRFQKYYSSSINLGGQSPLSK